MWLPVGRDTPQIISPPSRVITSVRACSVNLRPEVSVPAIDTRIA
jgi:hypothetical protein